MNIPVYLFMGFLESGKTKFISETLEDPRFNSGEETLLLVFEDGCETYDLNQYENIHVEIIGEQSDLCAETLGAMLKNCSAQRVIIEYNGMWNLETLFSNMPEGWEIAQTFLLCDAQTFIAYNQNMCELVVDKLRYSEIVAFNRCENPGIREELHKIVRAISRRTDILYEDFDGEVDIDDIEDPLPYDMSAHVIEIPDDGFAIWYRDVSEEMEKYEGKTVKIKGMSVRHEDLPGDIIIFGRHVMICCAEDISFAGMVCIFEGAHKYKTGQWLEITASIAIENHPAYGEPGPVLKTVSVHRADKPESDVATFY